MNIELKNFKYTTIAHSLMWTLAHAFGMCVVAQAVVIRPSRGT